VDKVIGFELERPNLIPTTDFTLALWARTSSAPAAHNEGYLGNLWNVWNWWVRTLWCRTARHYNRYFIL